MFYELGMMGGILFEPYFIFCNHNSILYPNSRD